MFGERWYVGVAARVGSVSDGNRFSSSSASLRYRVKTWSNNLSLGYRIRTEDFSEHRSHGYFDPSDFLSHLAVVDLTDKFWRRRAYYSLHLEVGVQSFEFQGFRFGSDEVIQWSGALGFPLGDRLYLEAYSSWSNYVLRSATGFRSRQQGIRLSQQLGR